MSWAQASDSQILHNAGSDFPSRAILNLGATELCSQGRGSQKAANAVTLGTVLIAACSFLIQRKNKLY